MVYYNISLTGDSNNSYLDGKFVKVYDEIDYISIKLESPDREIQVKKSDLIQVLKSMTIEKQL